MLAQLRANVAVALGGYRKGAVALLAAVDAVKGKHIGFAHLHILCVYLLHAKLLAGSLAHHVHFKLAGVHRAPLCGLPSTAARVGVTHAVFGPIDLAANKHSTVAVILKLQRLLRAHL